MTSFTTPKRSDMDYPVRMHYAIQLAHEAILGEKSQFSREKTTISEVKDLSEKLKGVRQREGAPHGDEFESHRDPYYYRQPMWDVIDAVLKDELETHDLLALVLLENPEDRVEWFQGILKLCFRYEMLQINTKTYVESLEDIGLSVGVDGLGEVGTNNPVTISFDGEVVGKNARPVVERVVQKLLEAVTLHIERFLADGYSYPQERKVEEFF